MVHFWLRTGCRASGPGSHYTRMVRGPPALHLVMSLALAALGGACQPPPPSPEPEIPDPGPATDASGLFSLDHLPVYHLGLGPKSWAALEQEPKVWVPGTFEYEGWFYDPVGIRLKGNHTLRPLDDKPAFKVKFNEYVKGTRFLGLEELVLNNMVVDRSMLREWVAYRVFRAVGAPAPRVGYAEVTVNGMEYGLYVNLESYDDEFLERVYEDPSGNLYEEEGAADVHRNVDLWDQDEGEDKSRDDLRALAALASQEGDAVFYGDQAIIDMPRFFGFMAGEVIIGHFDGYVGAHNYFIYHEPAADLWSFLPWSLDQALARRVTPYEHRGFLAQKCLWEPTCLVDYVVHANQALDTFAALDLIGDIQKIDDLTRSSFRADTRKPYSADQVTSARGAAKSWLNRRVDDLRPPLSCLVDGVEPDADEDGYGPCFQDCNEDDPAINPAAEELCDQVDNNCSGFVDDVTACECPSLESEGRMFYLCHNHRTWLQASSFCQAQGHELATFDSATQSAEVWAAAADVEGGRWAIGLNDRSTENDYRWPDGQAPDFDLWGSGEPAHQLDWFDCVFLANGKWYELNCIEQGSFICSD